MRYKIRPALRTLLNKADEIIKKNKMHLEDVSYFCADVEKELEHSRTKRLEKYFSLN